MTIMGSLFGSDSYPTQADIVSYTEKVDRRLRGTVSSELQVKGVTMLPGQVIVASCYPKTAQDLDRLNTVRSSMREEFPLMVDYPTFVYHISLAYIAEAMTAGEYRKFMNVMEDLHTKEFGELSTSNPRFILFDDISLTKYQLIKDYSLTSQSLTQGLLDVTGTSSEGMKAMLESAEIKRDWTFGDPAAEFIAIVAKDRKTVRSKTLRIHGELFAALLEKSKDPIKGEIYKEIIRALLLQESEHFNNIESYELATLINLKRLYEEKKDPASAKLLASAQLYYEQKGYNRLYKYLDSKGIDYITLKRLADELLNEGEDLLGSTLIQLSSFIRTYKPDSEEALLAIAKDLAQGEGYIAESMQIALAGKGFEDSLMHKPDTTSMEQATSREEETMLTFGHTRGIFSHAINRNITLDLASKQDISVIQGLAVAVSTGYKGEEEFKKDGGYVFGTEENGRYTIARFVPFSNIAVSREDYLEPSELDIKDAMSAYARDGIKLIGVYHNRSFVNLAQGQRLGPSGEDFNFFDFIREKAIEASGKENVAEELMGIVIEPRLDDERFMELARTNPDEALRLYKAHIDEIMIYAYIIHNEKPIVLDPVEFQKTIFRIDKKLHEDKTLTLV